MSFAVALTRALTSTKALKSLRHEISSKASSLQSLLAVPTSTELQACWELCRLQNGMGCATVYLPLLWSIAMVYHSQSTLTGIEAINRAVVYFFLCIGIKCLIMTIDDILDYDIDANVERTKNRALPRGAISIERAWLFFALQVIVGIALAFKVLSPNALAISMTVWPLYVIYPTCKRWMSFAPVPLGLMFNIGIFMGWADLTKDGGVAFQALMPVYIAALLWTITYETVYQHQDKVDDVKIGMSSLAIFCGKATIPVCTATTLGFASLMAYGGYVNGQGAAFYVAIVVCAYILLKNLLVTDIDNPKQCMRFFLLTPTIGNTVLAGLVVDAIYHRLTSGIPIFL